MKAAARLRRCLSFDARLGVQKNWSDNFLAGWARMPRRRREFTPTELAGLVRMVAGSGIPDLKKPGKAVQGSQFRICEFEVNPALANIVSPK